MSFHGALMASGRLHQSHTLRVFALCQDLEALPRLILMTLTHVLYSAASACFDGASTQQGNHIKRSHADDCKQ